MLTQEEISACGHTAVLAAQMPIDMSLRLATAIYQPPDEPAQDVIVITLEVQDEDDSMKIRKVLINGKLTENSLEIYLLGFIQGFMLTLEEGERQAVEAMIGDTARLH